MASPAWRWLSFGLLAAQPATSLSLNVNSASSIKAAASNVAWNMMHFYVGNTTANTPGNLPSPYYWWEAGAMFGHMVDYWYYTGDPSYNDEVIQAIVWQAGDNGFMPQNQTLDEGNDDQVFWAFAALDAAELKFPAPTTGPALWVEDSPSWIAMAQAVFNLQVPRWEPANCGGGLRWQIYTTNPGYDYKNIAANGGLFQLSARLARYTGNSTYLEWAEKEWNWLLTTSLIEQGNWTVNDGSGTDVNCQVPNIEQFSYNYGILLAGLAYLYDHTKDQKWITPLEGILNTTLDLFFPGESKVMVEIICEYTGTCNADALTFKSFTLRWLAVTAQLVPQYASQIWPYIAASAQGAAGQCDGSENGEYDLCGTLWNQTNWDGSTGPGQQMSALAAIGANMITLEHLTAPLSLSTGGTSKSDPNAGEGLNIGAGPTSAVYTMTITAGDRAGAGILTALVLAGLLGGTYWLIMV